MIPRQARLNEAPGATVSVVVPALDEASVIGATLDAAAEADEVILVDGGSSDATVTTASTRRFVSVLQSGRGRGCQMNHGARKARGDVLVFCHADTILPRGFREDILSRVRSSGCAWGRFNIRFDRGGPLLRLIAWLISTRSLLMRSATGDQAIFVERALFEQLGGYREMSLFEDVELCMRLKRASPMGVPAGYAITSSRRWRARGAVRTSLVMWGLKLAYLSGVPAERLSAFYPDER